jgi:methionine sulfoxide reductase heme-binding subunit
MSVIVPVAIAWLKTQWRWAILNLLAGFILLIVLTQGSQDWSTNSFEPMLESGKWAIRFLLLCLTMTPLHNFFRWSSALKLRKSIGLWAFTFALVHLLYYFDERWWDQRPLTGNWWPWQTVSPPLYLVLGGVGSTILTALALTSNRWSMRRLGKNWKRLHRLVYVAGMVTICHALLATTMSKKVMVRDPHAVSELRLYLGVLVVLLVVRIPQIRHLLQQTRAIRPAHPSTIQPIPPAVLPHRTIIQPPTLVVPPQLSTPLTQTPHETNSQGAPRREREIA